MIEFSFENPIYLWYLLSVPLMIYTHFYLLKRSKAKAMKFANFEAIKRITGKNLMTRNIAVLIIRVLVIICVIFAASGTVFWHDGNVNDNDYIIAIDVSASMTAQDIVPTRLDAAKQAAIDFVNSMKSSSDIGVVSFAGTVFIDSSLIDNKDSLRKTIENIQVSKTGGTDIGGAIITGTNLLVGSDKGKVIILITDGSNTLGAFIENSVQSSIDYANKNHVVIHSIGIGSESGPIGYLPEYYNVSAVYSENTLFKISNATHGNYYKAINMTGLEEAYKSMSNAAKKSVVPLKLSYGLMLIALLLLFIEWGFINTKFRKVP
jgi:Ca-activated chloride channel family protein